MFPPWEHMTVYKPAGPLSLCMNGSLRVTYPQLTSKLQACMRAALICALSRRHELPGDKAVLRLRHYYDSTPEANGGNAAMHLANLALHAVAARSTRTKDPRMRSLRSVGHLQV